MQLDLETELQKLIRHLQPSMDIKPRPATFNSSQEAERDRDIASTPTIPSAGDSFETSLPFEESGA